MCEENDERSVQRLREDRCEVSPDRPCAWQLIYTRLKEIGQLDRLKELKKPKNWRSESVRWSPQNRPRRPQRLKG